MSKNRDEYIEKIAEKVHDSWYREKEIQGFHSPSSCPRFPKRFNQHSIFEKQCTRCHPDMYPYHCLPEHVKEYDRVTVRTVLDAVISHIPTKSGHEVADEEA